MTGGMRVAGSAMSNFATRHDVISNNLANVSTKGFARQDTFVERLNALQDQPFQVPQVQTRTDFHAAGPPLVTGNHHDLSLEGSGFFSLADGDELRLARNVSLDVDPDGTLIDRQTGLAVLGQGGRLYAGDAHFSVGPDGDVMVSPRDDVEMLNARLLDHLQITTVRTGDALERDGQGLYRIRDGYQPDPKMERPGVLSGQQEGSSVSPVAELVRMIEAMRSYEAAASALRATDRTVEAAVNEIART